MQYTHQTVRDYAETQRIVREVTARFDTRTTDGSEARELFDATMAVRFGEGA